MAEETRLNVVPGPWPPNSSLDAGNGLRSGGGGGTYDGMETRVARLEADVAEIKTDLKALRSDTSYIKGRLDSMPTTVQMILFVVAVFVAAGITRYFGT